MKKHKIVFSAFLLIIVLNGCRIAADPIIEAITTAVLPDQLSGLKQISDYPFYELHYEGDYGFMEYLRTGLYSSSNQEPNPDLTYACSGFAAFDDTEQAIFGRNFDWHEHPALILFTGPPDGYASVSMVDISYLGYGSDNTPLDDPKRLLDAPYLPFDGMNAEGLAVCMMAVSHAEGGNDPGKITLDSLELIRLMLDYAENVPQALALIRDFNVDFGSVPIHYLLADRAGNSAVVEYLDGEAIVVHTEGKWQAATNFILSEENPTGMDSSCWRYNHITQTLSEANGRLDEGSGMKLLREVSQSGEMGTRWSVIYDLMTLNIFVAINGDFDHVYEFSLTD